MKLEQKLNYISTILLNNYVSDCINSMKNIKFSAERCKNNIQAACRVVDSYDNASEDEKQDFFSIISDELPSDTYSIIHSCLDSRYETHYLITFFDE